MKYDRLITLSDFAALMRKNTDAVKQLSREVETFPEPAITSVTGTVQLWDADELCKWESNRVLGRRHTKNLGARRLKALALIQAFDERLEFLRVHGFAKLRELDAPEPDLERLRRVRQR